MTELADVETVSLVAMKTAVVGNFVATLKRCGRNHLLVLEAATENGARRVSGVVSRSQSECSIGAGLTGDVSASGTQRSFFACYRALAGRLPAWREMASRRQVQCEPGDTCHTSSGGC